MFPQAAVAPRQRLKSRRVEECFSTASCNDMSDIESSDNLTTPRGHTHSTAVQNEEASYSDSSDCVIDSFPRKKIANKILNGVQFPELSQSGPLSHRCDSGSFVQCRRAEILTGVVRLLLDELESTFCDCSRGLDEKGFKTGELTERLVRPKANASAAGSSKTPSREESPLRSQPTERLFRARDMLLNERIHQPPLFLQNGQSPVSADTQTPCGARVHRTR